MPLAFVFSYRASRVKGLLLERLVRWYLFCIHMFIFICYIPMLICFNCINIIPVNRIKLIFILAVKLLTLSVCLLCFILSIISTFTYVTDVFRKVIVWIILYIQFCLNWTLPLLRQHYWCYISFICFLVIL